MGEVISLPGNVQRAWRLLRPEFQARLREHGVAECHIDPILDELGGYYENIAVEFRSDFMLPENFLDEERLEVLRVEFSRFLDDAQNKLYAPFWGAIGVILSLLIEKHQGNFNKGA